MNTSSVKISTIFFTLFLFTTIASIWVHTSLTFFNVTYFWWGVDILFLLLILRLKRFYFNPINDFKLIWPVLLFLAWNIISIIRGTFIAEFYWDWKQLISNGFVLLLPLVIYVFTNPKFVQRLILFWLKYALVLFFLFIPFVTLSDFYGRYLIPIMFLLLLLPILPKHWQIITLLFTFLVLSVGLDARTNVIRFSIAALLGILYYGRLIIRPWFFKIIHAILISLPIMLFILGVTGTFNIFKSNKEISKNYQVETTVDGKKIKENLGADTRTFIYVEALGSAIKHDYILLGRTPARGYDSAYFGGFNKYELKMGRLERYSSEVSIINIFTWTGLIGVILYFTVFLRASFLAVYRSNNHFIKIIGLYVTFRWIVAFFEDFTVFDINYLFLWLMISMCFSVEFRDMSDQQFKTWTRGIFQNKPKGYTK